MEEAITKRRRRFRNGAGRVTTWGTVGLLLILAVVCAPLLIKPSWPQHVVIATGSADGAYFEFANRYREILARDGIDLEVRTTAGSVENLKLLNTRDSDVSLAVVQGGVTAQSESTPIESLASLYFEPVWVFYRADRFRDTALGNSKPVERLTQLMGKRIAVGVDGSGTQSIAMQLLRENRRGGNGDGNGNRNRDGNSNWNGNRNGDGNGNRNGDANENRNRDGNGESAIAAPATPIALGGREAVEALQAGQVDAAFFVISPTSPLVRDLLSIPGVELMSFRHAEAYCKRHPFLSSVTLAEGTVDLENNLPRRDTVLLAPTANLVCRKTLHSALIPLLLGAASEVHEDGGVLEKPGEFPSAQFVDFPLNSTARRYLKSGPSMIYRYLPFATAAWVDRLKLMLLPLCTLLYPLLKAAPPIYRWRIRSKIYRWYRVLREIDQKMHDARCSVDFSAEIESLIVLETELAEVSVPLAYMQEFYNLHQHIDFVRERLRARDRSYSAAYRRAA